MKNFYYTKTHALLKELDVVDSLKKQIALLVLSPKEELQLKWRGILNTIFFSLKLHGRSFTQEKIVDLLSPKGKQKLTEEEKLVQGFKKALDYIFFNWNVNPAPLTYKEVEEIFFILFNEKITLSREDLSQRLQYLQVTSEHPFVQATLAHILFFDAFETLSKYKLLAEVMFILFLYKNGYTFRGFSSIQRDFVERQENYKEITHLALEQENLTTFIEYFARCQSNNLTAVIDNIDTKAKSSNVFFELTDRHKAILSLLDSPNLTITNKKVQELFKVSQITASRDLSRLTALGLLFAIGKGRSTYYTKV